MPTIQPIKATDSSDAARSKQNATISRVNELDNTAADISAFSASANAAARRASTARDESRLLADGIEGAADIVLPARDEAVAAKVAAETARNAADAAATETAAQVGIATTQAGLATAGADTATAQAVIATGAASTATTQAGTATTQAGIATDAAGAAAADAAAAALYDGPRFATIAAAAGHASYADGGFAIISPTGETFQYDATSTATADGALIVTATGMGVGRLISTRTVYATVQELEDDNRTGFKVGGVYEASGVRYEVVAPTLVANGTFDTDVIGWTPEGAGVTATWNAGAMDVVATTQTWVYDEIDTIIGETYRITLDFIKGGGGRVYVGPSIGSFSLLTISASGSYDLTFVATTEKTFISVGDPAKTGATNTVDNIAVVADGDAADPAVLTNAGGVRFKILPNDDGSYSFHAMNPAKDGVTDDYEKLRTLLDSIPQTATVTSSTPQIPKVIFGYGKYYFGQPINLKKVVHLKGQSTGLAGGENGTVFQFPQNTHGIIVHRSDTNFSGVESPATTGADGSIIEGITPQSSYDGTVTNAHGIWLRARARVVDCNPRLFAGNGIHIYAQASGTGILKGNANNFSIERVRPVANLRHGVYVRGADANSGYGYAIDCTNNGGYGIYDASFLGNTWAFCHASGNGYRGIIGVTDAPRAFCTYAGNTYMCNPDTALTDISYTGNEPGTNKSIWVPTTNVSLPPGVLQDWEMGQTPGLYKPGGSYCSAGSNGKAVFIGCYVEGSQGRVIISQRGLWMHGPSEYDVYGPNIMGFQSLIRQTGTQFVPPEDVSFGTDVTRVMANTGVAWQYQGADNNLVQFGNNGSSTWYLGTSSGLQRPFHITKPGTGYAFGRGSPQEYKCHIPDLFIGGTGANDGRQITTRSSTPTSGTYSRGDIIFNSSSVAAGKAGWMCTTSGVAGSTAVFKPFGAIDA